MTDVIWASIITGSVGVLGIICTLLGVLITQYHESKKRESEEKRWYADYFLSKKIDALNNLYAALVDCHFAMNFYGNCPPRTLQEYKDEIEPKLSAYLRAKVIASIYMDDKAEDIMSKALGAFRQASMAIALSMPDNECPLQKDSYSSKTRNLDWDDFVKTYDNAVTCLKEHLNPKVLDKYFKANKEGAR